LTGILVKEVGIIFRLQQLSVSDIDLDMALQVLRRANTEKDVGALSLYRIYISTTAVMFLGTPHRGSSWVELGNTVRRLVSAAGFDTSDQNLRALRIDGAELDICQEGFMQLYEQRRFEVRTFQEAQGMTGLGFFKFNGKVSPNYLKACL
jgi:hypothetical protein